MSKKRGTSDRVSNYQRKVGARARLAREKAETKASGEKPPQAEDAIKKQLRENPFHRLLRRLREDNERAAG